ncbi:MAG TPA: hypothetical protein VEJ86_10225 [Candidatus Binataceae bacterium]|nr:hypothetical protein [Candidatus Binataceae bacterium]
MRFGDCAMPVRGIGPRLMLGLAVVTALLLSVPAAAADPAQGATPFPIYYQGAEDLVLTRLQLDPNTVVAPSLAEAKTAVFQNQLPPPGADLDALKARVASGMGLVLITGSEVSAASLAALTNGAVTQTGVVDEPPGPEHARKMEAVAAPIEYVGPKDDPLAHGVNWSSAVRLAERSLLKTTAAATVLVATSAKDPVQGRTPALIRLTEGKGTIFILNVWLRQGDQSARVASYGELLKGIRGARNYDFQRWFYFNWLLYDLSRSAAGVPAKSYGDWAESPVPHRAQNEALAVLFFSMMAIFLAAFLWVRRYSLRHPELVNQYYRPLQQKPQPASLGAAAATPLTPAKTPTVRRGDPRWEVVGFHRPLSGYFYNYLLALVIMIPFNFVTTFYIERTFVNPFLEARGAWNYVVQFMLIFFTLLDLGTGPAMVKYFAQYRVKEPGKAMEFAQFFIWFHLLCGVLQITALGLLAGLFLPHTAAAYLTWFVILHALIQFPGFQLIFLNLFRGLQRFDYAELLIVLFYVLNPIAQLACGIYFRHWGLMHPVFGEGMGVVFGFAIGGVAANLFLGGFCSIFYHRVGFKLTTMFLAHFDRKVVRESLIYGVKLTGGQLLAAASWGMLPVIMGLLLPNFLELNEIFILTYSLTFGYLETGVYIFSTLVPSISESHSQHMMQLTRRYLDQGLRWGMIGTGMLGGAYIAFADIMIKGLLPPQFIRAVGVLVLIHLWRAADFTTRMPDQVFQAVGRTGLFTLTAVVEHVGRIILWYELIKLFGFPGLFYGFIAAALLKSAIAWPLMGKTVAWPSVSWWQTIFNPILAMVVSYAVLRTAALALWSGPGHIGNTFGVVALALFGSLPVYMFISGLLGWDTLALAEFRSASEIVPAPFGAIARLAHRCAQLGSSLSPLHDRFPGKLAAEAFSESTALTALKAELH